MVWLSENNRLLVWERSYGCRLLHLLQYDFYLIKQTRVDSYNKSQRDALFLKFICPNKLRNSASRWLLLQE